VAAEANPHGGVREVRPFAPLNVLVHEYVRVDPRHVLEALRRAPGQFSAFAREVSVWLIEQREGRS